MTVIIWKWQVLSSAVCITRYDLNEIRKKKSCLFLYRSTSPSRASHFFPHLPLTPLTRFFFLFIFMCFVTLNRRHNKVALTITKKQDMGARMWWKVREEKRKRKELNYEFLLCVCVFVRCTMYESWSIASEMLNSQNAKEKIWRAKPSLS